MEKSERELICNPVGGIRRAEVELRGGRDVLQQQTTWQPSTESYRARLHMTLIMRISFADVQAQTLKI